STSTTSSSTTSTSSSSSTTSTSSTSSTSTTSTSSTSSSSSSSSTSTTSSSTTSTSSSSSTTSTSSTSSTSTTSTSSTSSSSSSSSTSTTSSSTTSSSSSTSTTSSSTTSTSTSSTTSSTTSSSSSSSTTSRTSSSTSSTTWTTTSSTVSSSTSTTSSSSSSSSSTTTRTSTTSSSSSSSTTSKSLTSTTTSTSTTKSGTSTTLTISSSSTSSLTSSTTFSSTSTSSTQPQCVGFAGVAVDVAPSCAELAEQQNCSADILEIDENSTSDNATSDAEMLTTCYSPGAAEFVCPRGGGELVLASQRVRCQVCAAEDFMDLDETHFQVSGTLRWGPNTLLDQVDESMLDGYELWIVDSCGERLLFVASLQKRSAPMETWMTECCDASTYSLDVNMALPSDYFGFMVVPYQGAERLAAGAIVPIVERTSTTSTRSSTTSTSQTITTSTDTVTTVTGSSTTVTSSSTRSSTTTTTRSISSTSATVTSTSATSTETNTTTTTVTTETTSTTTTTATATSTRTSITTTTITSTMQAPASLEGCLGLSVSDAGAFTNSEDGRGALRNMLARAAGEDVQPEYVQDLALTAGASCDARRLTGRRLQESLRADYVIVFPASLGVEVALQVAESGQKALETMSLEEATSFLTEEVQKVPTLAHVTVTVTTKKVTITVTPIAQVEVQTDVALAVMSGLGAMLFPLCMFLIWWRCQKRLQPIKPKIKDEVKDVDEPPLRFAEAALEDTFAAVQPMVYEQMAEVKKKKKLAPKRKVRKPRSGQEEDLPEGSVKKRVKKLRPKKAKNELEAEDNRIVPAEIPLESFLELEDEGVVFDVPSDVPRSPEAARGSMSSLPSVPWSEDDALVGRLEAEGVLLRSAGSAPAAARLPAAPGPARSVAPGPARSSLSSLPSVPWEEDEQPSASSAPAAARLPSAPGPARSSLSSLPSVPWEEDEEPPRAATRVKTPETVPITPLTDTTATPPASKQRLKPKIKKGKRSGKRRPSGATPQADLEGVQIAIEPPALWSDESDADPERTPSVRWHDEPRTPAPEPAAPWSDDEATPAKSVKPSTSVRWSDEQRSEAPNEAIDITITY
ncbi:unnamed protein product, partial [Effrenium voratum]